MRALIVGNGEVDQKALKYFSKHVDEIVAVDNGASALASAGIRPHRIVGDFDSLTVEMPDGCNVERYEVDKDMSDGELAIKSSLKRSIKEVIGLGFFGGAIDHTIANVALLTLSILKPLKLRFIHDQICVEVLHRGIFSFNDMKGEPISFIALKNSIVNMKGFKYNKVDGILKVGTHGLSNVITTRSATIVVRRGLILACYRWANIKF